MDKRGLLQHLINPHLVTLTLACKPPLMFGAGKKEEQRAAT